ncbi:hypothetical protein WN48_03445 [Eufriesea mexicana]|nr:hypothetical protein WN48_03445 [Eufriesea mexicana]
MSRVTGCESTSSSATFAPDTCSVRRRFSRNTEDTATGPPLSSMCRVFDTLALLRTALAAVLARQTPILDEEPIDGRWCLSSTRTEKIDARQSERLVGEDRKPRNWFTRGLPNVDDAWSLGQRTWGGEWKLIHSNEKYGSLYGYFIMKIRIWNPRLPCSFYSYILLQHILCVKPTWRFDSHSLPPGPLIHAAGLYRNYPTPCDYGYPERKEICPTGEKKGRKGKVENSLCYDYQCEIRGFEVWERPSPDAKGSGHTDSSNIQSFFEVSNSLRFDRYSWTEQLDIYESP